MYLWLVYPNTFIPGRTEKQKEGKSCIQADFSVQLKPISSHMPKVCAAHIQPEAA